MPSKTTTIKNSKINTICKVLLIWCYCNTALISSSWHGLMWRWTEKLGFVEVNELDPSLCLSAVRKLSSRMSERNGDWLLLVHVATRVYDSEAWSELHYVASCDYLICWLLTKLTLTWLSSILNIFCRWTELRPDRRWHTRCILSVRTYLYYSQLHNDSLDPC